MRNVVCMTVLAVLTMVLVGCGQPRQVVSSELVCIPQVSPYQVMDASQKVLTKMQFSLEKYDLDAGYLRTRPLSGSQFFQLFRGDNASARATLEANIYSLRRIVEIEVSQVDNSTCVKCRVFVQQLSIPERPIEGMSQMAGAYTSSNRRIQTLQIREEQLKEMEWIDRGMDHQLEQKIIEQMKETIEKG